MKWKYNLLLFVVTEVVTNERSASKDIIADVPKPENVYPCTKCSVTFLFLAGHEHWLFCNSLGISCISLE